MKQGPILTWILTKDGIHRTSYRGIRYDINPYLTNSWLTIQCERDSFGTAMRRVDPVKGQKPVETAKQEVERLVMQMASNNGYDIGVTEEEAKDILKQELGL